MSRLYLDHNATTPLRPEARAAMLAALDASGNASSIHGEGRAARATIETARAQVAALVGARPAAVVFTSGGTEAANLALTPDIGGAGAPFARLIVSAGEHPCVLDGHRFPAGAVARAPLLPDGRVDLAALDTLVAGGRVMLALQAANNETGVLQPVAEAAALVRAHGGLVVCDAVQMAGKLPFDMGAAGVDAAILSAHKIGGPPGAGALVFGRPALHILPAMLRGGGQERGQRAGTENAPAIAGFGAAAQAAGAGMTAEAERLGAIRDAIEADIRALRPDAVFFGAGAPRLPQVSAFALPGRQGQVDRRRSVQIRLRDRHRIREGPQGAERGHRPLHLGQEERAGMDAGMAAGRLPPLEDDDRADLGARALSADRLSGSVLLRRAEERRAEVARRGRSRTAAHLREARHSAARAEVLPASRARASRSMRCSIRSRWSRPSRAELAKAGVIFCPISEAVREHPELVKKYLGTVVPTTDNFYATLNSAVFSDGSFVYIPPGVRCPMELSTYFRINEQKTGQFERTLIIADKGSYVSYLEGCTAPKRDENQLARRRGRTDRARRRRDQVFDGAELVSRRQGRQGRHLQLRHQARRLPRARAEDLVDAGRDRLGHHLEISVLHPARRGLVAASSIRSPFPTATSRSIQRHQDDPSGQANTTSKIISKGISAGARRTPIAARSRPIARPRARATSPIATAC
jgi:cysteine desulfurase